jgi:hypothetical protein
MNANSASRRLRWSICAMFLYATSGPIDRLDSAAYLSLPAACSVDSRIIQFHGEIGEIRLCPVKPGDGGKRCGAVFQRSKRLFLPIDTRADSFVTSVRINNVILRRISRAVGRFAQPALRMRFHSQALKFIASPFDASFFASSSSRWDKLRAAGLQRSCVVYECYDQERIVAYG